MSRRFRSRGPSTAVQCTLGPVPTCTQCRAEIAAQARVCPSCHALQPIAQGGLGPGVTIDRSDSKLVIDAKIGEGGMGVVFRAWRFYSPGDPRVERRPEACRAQGAYAPIAPRTLGCANIFVARPRRSASCRTRTSCSSTSSFEHGDASVLAMEFVDGEPLDAIIKRHKSRATPHVDPVHARAARRRVFRAAPRRARRAPRDGHRPPRREAAEHPRAPRRNREAHRLRHREARLRHAVDGAAEHRSGARAGHGHLHVSRASDGRRRRRAQRPLLGRDRALRDARGAHAVLADRQDRDRRAPRAADVETPPAGAIVLRAAPRVRRSRSSRARSRRIRTRASPTRSRWAPRRARRSACPRAPSGTRSPRW